MREIAIRYATGSDFESIIKLNDVAVEQTSQMDLEKLRLLDRLSVYHKVAVVDGRVAPFLLVIRHGTPYENDNYRWFASHLSKFLYVDRIVVGPEFARLKVGSALYTDLFQYAREERVRNIVCEYNIEPQNPASRAFHSKFGFREMGTQWIADTTKLVSLQAAAI